jgi:hypothetical protein
MHRQSVLVCTQVNLAGLVRGMFSHLDTRVLMLMWKNFTIMCYRLSGAYRYYSFLRCGAVQCAIDIITFGTNWYLYVPFFQGSTDPRRFLTTGVLGQGLVVFWKYPLPPIFPASKHFSTVWFTAQSATKRFFSDGELPTDAFAYTIHLISTRSYYIYVIFKLLAHMIVVTPLHWFWYILYLYFL